MSNRFFGIVAVLAVAAGLFAIFGSSGESPQGSSATSTTPAAAPAPRVTVPAVTLPRADGGIFSSAALRGKSGNAILVVTGEGNLHQGQARASGVMVVADLPKAVDEILKDCP